MASPRSVEHRVSRWEWFTLGIFGCFHGGGCLGFPLIASVLMIPILWKFWKIPVFDPFNVYIIFVIMVGLLILLPLGLFYFAFVNKGYKTGRNLSWRCQY